MDIGTPGRPAFFWGLGSPPLLHWSICTSIIVGSSTNNVSIVVVNPCGSYPDIAFVKELRTTLAACVLLADRLAT